MLREFGRDVSDFEDAVEWLVWALQRRGMRDLERSDLTATGDELRELGHTNEMGHESAK